MGSQPPDPVRDAAEMELFRAFFRAGKPIFGICRGFQLINVALGGTLVQDIIPELRLFHTRGTADRVHAIRATEGSLLYRLYGQVFTVNSSHHQVLDRLGEGITPTAWAEPGFPEGFEIKDAPVFAVQFHPERMSYGFRRPDTVDGAPLFEHFISLCRR